MIPKFVIFAAGCPEILVSFPRRELQRVPQQIVGEVAALGSHNQLLNQKLQSGMHRSLMVCHFPIRSAR